jgi:hypothetical protein
VSPDGSGLDVSGGVTVPPVVVSSLELVLGPKRTVFVNVAERVVRSEPVPVVLTGMFFANVVVFKMYVFVDGS